MKRRKFIRNSIGATVAGSAMVNGLYFPPASGAGPYDLPSTGIESPHLTRLVVKPVMTNMYHTDIWEGPCRFNVTTVEDEKKAVQRQFGNFSRQLEEHAFGLDRENCRVMDPGLVVFVEDFEIPGEEFSKIDKDAREADVLYIWPGGSSTMVYEIAARYNKPVILAWGINCRTVDISSYCRSMGIETFIPHTPEETAELVSVLRARKVFRQTRILCPTDMGWPTAVSAGVFNEPDRLGEMFGIGLETIGYLELKQEMERSIQDPEEQQKATEMARELVRKADRVFLEEKYVAKSMLFYNTVIRLMKKHNCNAFAIECFEFCASRLADDWNVTPCLIHTLLKDQGIPSACEADLGALLAMHMLMSLSGKSSHLGNMFYREGGKMEINHSVPGIRMNGWKEPSMPYQLGRFVQSGWGTNAVVDFMMNEEKNITVARMNPAGTGMLILKGKLVGSRGWDEDLLGCAVSAYVVGRDSGTADAYMRRLSDYGNHLIWVYGDYARQLARLCELNGIEPEVMS